LRGLGSVGGGLGGRGEGRCLRWDVEMMVWEGGRTKKKKNLGKRKERQGEGRRRRKEVAGNE